MKKIKTLLITLFTLVLFTSFYTDIFAASKTKSFSQKKKISLLKRNSTTNREEYHYRYYATCVYDDNPSSPNQEQNIINATLNQKKSVTCYKDKKYPLYIYLSNVDKYLSKNRFINTVQIAKKCKIENKKTYDIMLVKDGSTIKYYVPDCIDL